MDLPLHYLHIKNMFNLTLFNDIDADQQFLNSDTIKISVEYISFFKGYQSIKNLADNKFLRESCVNYLTRLAPNEKDEIIMVIKDNPLLISSIYILYELKLGKMPSKSYEKEFEKDLETYKNMNTVPNSISLFFQQHFLNFDRVDIFKFPNFEVNREQYFHLLKDYLKPQLEVF